MKWGFKWWFQCMEFDLYLSRKKDVENNLWESVVMQLSEKLKGTYCTLFFNIFFNSPTLTDKLFKEGIYVVGTVRSNRKQILL